MPDYPSINSARSGAGRFATTHWSVVLAAAQPESTRYQQALEALCRTYWFPLYAYLRRHGYNAQKAEDHIQAFFVCLLEKRGLRLADPKRGRFRSFLLTALKHFLANELDRARAQKRGGGQKIVSLNVETAENQYALEPAHELSPEKLFEKSWALTVLDRTMDRLEAESARKNKQRLFECLKSYLGPELNPDTYRDVAVELDMTEGAVKVTLHRLRKRFRQLLRDEIAQTVAAEDQIDQEIRDLFDALAS